MICLSFFSDILLNSTTVDEFETKIPNIHLKPKLNHTVELHKVVTDLDNNSKIYCIARRYNGPKKVDVVKSKNLTLILERDYKNINEYVTNRYDKSK